MTGPLRRWLGLISLNSVSGRTFWFLTIGTAVAALVTMTLAEFSRRQDFENLRIGQLVARVVQVEDRWSSGSTQTERMNTVGRLLGVQRLETPPSFDRDPAVEARLSETLGAAYRPYAGLAPLDVCLPAGAEPIPPASSLQIGSLDLTLECWVVSFALPGEARESFALYQPPVVTPEGAPRNPIFLMLLIASIATMSLLVARFLTRPLHRLSEYARAFSVSIDAPDAEVRGPREVQAALSTFNIMQARVRAELQARTQLLASISHDLQTPLTRLRLRLEQVTDESLRDRLVADVNAMQALVREGLDLARSHETSEDWSVVDIDSLVESLAADAAEFGGDVRFISGCGASVRVKPNALARALNNLIDNAVKYGGSADLKCRTDGERVVIEVRDKGPGLPDPGDPRLFEPFYRGDPLAGNKPKGTGIGLTIARAQAALSGASIRLSNNDGGGLSAEIFLPYLATAARRVT